MLHLALKAFQPGRLPFPVMHVDTGHKLDEVIARPCMAGGEKLRGWLVVASVQEDVARRPGCRDHPSRRNPIQTVTLLRAIRENKFDAGVRRGAAQRGRAKEAGVQAR